MCSMYQKFFSITGNFTCQSRCNVTIKDVDLINNKIVIVSIKVGPEIFEYLPCQQVFHWGEVHMNIICPAWNEGKFMKHRNLHDSFSCLLPYTNEL